MCKGGGTSSYYRRWTNTGGKTISMDFGTSCTLDICVLYYIVRVSARERVYRVFSLSRPPPYPAYTVDVFCAHACACFASSSSAMTTHGGGTSAVVVRLFAEIMTITIISYFHTSHKCAKHFCFILIPCDDAGLWGPEDRVVCTLETNVCQWLELKGGGGLSIGVCRWAVSAIDGLA